MWISSSRYIGVDGKLKYIQNGGFVKNDLWLFVISSIYIYIYVKEIELIDRVHINYKIHGEVNCYHLYETCSIIYKRGISIDLRFHNSVNNKNFNELKKIW